jgi:hypothetical protein
MANDCYYSMYEVLFGMVGEGIMTSEGDVLRMVGERV